MRLAVELIARKMRLSVVRAETHISLERLRALYRELHDESPPSGQLPNLGCAFLTSRRLQLEASLFALAYQKAGGSLSAGNLPEMRLQDMAAVIDAYDLCVELYPSWRLSITQCWAVARDLRLEASWLMGCLRCEVAFLISESGRFDDCPVCSLYRNFTTTVEPRVAHVAPRLRGRSPGFRLAERGFLEWVGRQPVAAAGRLRDAAKRGFVASDA